MQVKNLIKKKELYYKKKTNALGFLFQLLLKRFLDLNMYR